MAMTADDVLAIVATEAGVDPAALRPDATLADLDISSLDVVSVLFELEDRYGVEVDAELCEEPATTLPAKEALYRIAQEGLHNVVKHARATHVDLKLECAGGLATLDIRDNGTGFDSGGEFPGHLGLRSMRERATRLGGTFDVESEPGKGTHLRAVVPLTLEEVPR